MSSAPICNIGAGRTWTAAELVAKQERDGRAWRQAAAEAAMQAEIKKWIERDPGAVIAEIEKDGQRRVFLSDDGSVCVRGRGTGEQLKIALRHHERLVRVILRDREAIEEIIPAPEPAGPAAQAA